MASISSLARRWAIVFSRRWRGEPARPRTAGGGGGGGAGAARDDLDRDLVGRAADAAGPDLERGRQGLDGGLELLDRVLAGLLADDGERVVGDPRGRALLAVEQDLVDDLDDQARAVDGIRLDGPDGCGGAAGHEVSTSS